MRAGVDEGPDVIAPPKDKQGKAVNLNTSRLAIRRFYQRADNRAFHRRAGVGFPSISHMAIFFASCRLVNAIDPGRLWL